MRSAAPPLGGVVVAVLEADEDDDDVEEEELMRPRVPRSREAREPTHMKADLWLLMLPGMWPLVNPDMSTLPATAATAACC